jgi:hypothetical protein
MGHCAVALVGSQWIVVPLPIRAAQTEQAPTIARGQRMTKHWRFGSQVAALSFVLWNAGPANAQRAQSGPFTTQAERCIIPAAQYHSVNPWILRAILRVESGFNASAIGVNRNGTRDLGIGQINTVHFRELAKYGIAPEHLMDACIGTYVAAWTLKASTAKWGNTWFGVAAYHSSTPSENHRYQILLHNALVRDRIFAGPVLPAPIMR